MTTTTESTAPRGRARACPACSARGLLYVVVWSLQIVSGSLVSPVLAHLMGPAEFGQLASAIALHQVLIVLAVLGIDQALILQRAEAGARTATTGPRACSSRSACCSRPR